jgi:predicted permease
MQLFSILIDVVGPVFLVALVGYVWSQRGAPFDPRFIALMVTSVATPSMVIDSLSTSGLQTGALGAIALASLLCHALSLGAGWLFVRAVGQPTTVFVPALTFPNTGNMGLPLGMFAFGPPGLALSIGYYAVASLLQFTVGQSIAAKQIDPRALLRMPLIWAIAFGLFLALTGLQLPSVASRGLHILGGLMVPLMLLSLGYSLARLKFSSLGRGVMFSTARLFGGFAIGWLVATLLGLDGLARGVVVVQSSMPSAVYNYMFAERFGNQPEEVAGVVVVSTLMSIPLLPIFMSTVM